MGNGSIAVFGFLNFAILARQLSLNSFGSWIIFTSSCIFFELLRTGFLQTPLIKYLSGVEIEVRDEILGSSWAFAWLITGAIFIVSIISFLLLGRFIENEGFFMFLKWIWIVNLLSLPSNFATWYLQSQLKFGEILLIRLISQGSFFLLLVLNFYLKQDLPYVLYSYLFSSFLTSVICIAANWTFITLLGKATKKRMTSLFHFGKYSMGTMIASNLLRTSDTLLIGAFMGNAAVAVYSVPARMFELIEVPLRSFVSTALPTLSKLYNTDDIKGLKYFFEKSAGLLTIILIPFMLFCFIFAEPLVVLLGGEEYIGSANILRIFTLYACFMPIDRFTGITLDIMNVPVRNFQKVMIMLVINIVGDMLAIKLIGECWAVAVGSIVTFLVGVILSTIFLKQKLDFSIGEILTLGYQKSIEYTNNVLKGVSKP